jgi:pimeloyl-ACP methyl ester carboxylesterase
VTERPIEVAAGDGVLRGHVGGTGAPALLLHGGPGLPDYMEGCASELSPLFTTIRYTQRGVEPGTVGPPYTIEAHMADALAVLDALGHDRAWAIGHSWGGHLALHLAVAHPGRLHGVVAIDPLGASPDVMPEFAQRLYGRMPDGPRRRAEEIEERWEAGEATRAELSEQFELIWPYYFAEPASAPPPLVHTPSPECYSGTFASITEHFERGTLRDALPGVLLPALFVHGVDDPLPIRSSTETARLIPGARVDRVARCGHFPWLEQPGVFVRSIRSLVSD